MAHYSQTQLEHDRVAAGFDEDAARDRLAALEDAEGKEAVQERKHLRRRLDVAAARSAHWEALNAQPVEQIVAGIAR